MVMRCVLPIAIVIGLAPLHVRAGDLDIRTAHGAVLCATPFQLRKAIVAAHRDEAQRVWQLGCMRAGRGIKVIFSDGIAPPYGPWQVQLVPDDGPSLSMWGYASSFTTYPDMIFSPVENTSLADPD
jgi:hypothetical protein